MNDYERKIMIMAHKYWNEDIIPPEEYRKAVWEYIRDNPDEFGGAVPQ